MKKNEKPTIVYQNRPNVNRILQTLCDLLTKQDEGRYEYTYVINNKTEENQNAR